MKCQFLLEQQRACWQWPPYLAQFFRVVVLKARVPLHMAASIRTLLVRDLLLMELVVRQQCCLLALRHPLGACLRGGGQIADR